MDTMEKIIEEFSSRTSNNNNNTRHYRIKDTGLFIRLIKEEMFITTSEKAVN